MMPIDQPTPVQPALQGLEWGMKAVSRLIAGLGFGLMIFGLVDFLTSGSLSSLPGISVLRFNQFWPFAQISPAVASMSAGIIMLALLPAIRVLLALWTFSRQHAWVNMLAALIVFLELILSMRVGS